jgi:hypothetical protein
MAKSAIVVLNSTGTVVRTHSPDISTSGSAASAPTAGPLDLETLITQGYLAIRETRLDGGDALIVLQKP